MNQLAPAQVSQPVIGTCCWDGCGAPATRRVYATTMCASHELEHFAQAREANMAGAIQGIELLAGCVDWGTSIHLHDLAAAMRRRADDAASGALVVASVA